ncbi:MAG: hypothetical protein II793_01420, partial [Bacteroidales bacterium]|nr:hypothetical protein [Bacteroidales bacterium]
LEKKSGGWNENKHHLNFSPKDLNDILALCERAAKDRRVRNKAMWKYTAAAINMYQNHPDKALANLKGAEQGCRDKFLSRSVRMMRFNIHARYDSIDDNYYAMLYDNLRWIDKEMTDELRGLSQKDRKRIEDEYECEWLRPKRSVYTNDMLQYILFDGKNAVCRRQIRKGREVLALQLASMGGTLFEKRYFGKLQDKTGEMFYLADGLSADTLRAFYQSVLSPSNQMGRFLAQRGVTDRDYWSDIIGTHLLRERRYQMAVNYLSACSDDYEDGLAIKEYCHYDPFDLNRKAALDKKHYRLSFAKEMAYHEKMMHQAKDANVRAEHQIMYSIGLENSMTRDWTLISYGYGEIDGLYKPSTRPYNAFLESEYGLWSDDCWRNTVYYRKVGLWAADKLRDKAIDMYTDPEAKARGYARLYMIAQVMEELPNTEQGQFYARHCDQWKDYLLSK